MIVECYTADVYCDMEMHVDYHPMPYTFTGHSKRSTDRQRRRAGWIKVNGDDCCPKCAQKLRDNRDAKRAGG